MSSILEFAISKLGYVPVFMKVWEKNFWPIFKTFLTNRGKTEDENEKIWKNELNFLILHIKIRLYGNFYENMLKKVLTHFFGHFWLIEAKTKMKVKKYGKMSSIFEFSISKLRYVGIFMKVWEKVFDPFLKIFLTNLGKMKMKMKKYGKIIWIFEFSKSKLRYLVIFMKIGEKNFWANFKTFLTNRGKMKMKLKKFRKMSSIFEFFISKSSSQKLSIKIWEKRFFSKFLPEKDLLGQSCWKS